MKKTKRGDPARYDVLWHTPATPDTNLGVREGDYFVSGLNNVTASQLRARALNATWPIETIFEVTRRGGKKAAARCYIEQIKAWTPDQSLPTALSIDLPVSQSEIIDKFRDLLNEALLFAIANGLFTEAQTDDFRRILFDQLE